MKDMGREYERLFGALPGRDAPAYLCERVLGAVSRERVRILRMRLVFSSCAALASLIGVVSAASMLVSAMAASGFSAYASLFISDGSLVPAFGSSFLLSLAESLPGPEVALALFLIAVLIQSLRVLARSSFEWAFIMRA